MPASWAYASDCGMSTRATLAPARRSPGAGRGRLSRRGPAPATPCCDASIRVATRSCRGNRRPFGRIAALEPVHHSSHHEHGLAPAAAQNRRHVGAPRLVAAHDGERRPGRELVRALPRVSGREEESGCDVPVSVLEALARVYDRVPRGGPVQLVDVDEGEALRRPFLLLPGLEPALEVPENVEARFAQDLDREDRKSTRLNSSHVKISYAVFC